MKTYLTHEAGAGRLGSRPRLLLGLVLLLTGGCAHYEYRLAQPAQFAGMIGAQEARVDLPPVDYRLIEDQHRLILVANNTSDQPLLVLGPKSYVVDPRGETHPLHGGTIAPHSHVRMVLPPQPPTYTPNPTFGFGVGYGWGYPFWGFGSGAVMPYDPFYAPGPYEGTPANRPGCWDWHTGEVRLHMAYEPQGAPPFAHDFRFERRRMK